jgi:HNH endonuclease
MATFDPTAPEEIWYPIPGYPYLEISNRYRVRSWHVQGSRSGRRADKPRLRAVQGGLQQRGRQYLHVRVEEKSRNRIEIVYLHHVVAHLVYGPCPDGLQVLHRDDNKHNLNPSNLYYGTSQDNADDRIKNGRTREARGATNSNAILTDQAVREIRAAWDSRLKKYGERLRLAGELAERYGVSPKTIQGIGERRRWTHVPESLA